jgi:hypothetical protein
LVHPAASLRQLTTAIAALSALASGGCTAPESQRQEEASAGNGQAPAGTERERRRGDVYLAFAPQPEGPSPAALFGGRLEVADGCLVLRSQLATHIPVFSPSPGTYVTPSAAVIGGRAIPLGSAIQIAGGELGACAEALLAAKPPPQCRHRLLRVVSIGQVSG